VRGALPVAPEEVAAAHRRLHGVCHRTLLFTSSALDREAGCRVLLKGENFQRVGAFKLRGAYNFLARMEPEERRHGVVAASSGNHGQGVARAAKLFGCKATIVVPEDIIEVKREAIERDDAEIVVAGVTSDVRLAEAERIAEETGATFVPAFDHPWIIAGQGTVAKEMLEDAPHIDALVVPIGGGGLAAGMAAWAKGQNPRIKVYGVEPDTADSMNRSMHSRFATRCWTASSRSATPRSRRPCASCWLGRRSSSNRAARPALPPCCTGSSAIRRRRSPPS
jgi:threonine dehydratase